MYAGHAVTRTCARREAGCTSAVHIKNGPQRRQPRRIQNEIKTKHPNYTLWIGETQMDYEDYFRVWTLFRERMAKRAMDAVSTEIQDHYNQILQDMALLEAEVFLEK